MWQNFCTFHHLHFLLPGCIWLLSYLSQAGATKIKHLSIIYASKKQDSCATFGWKETHIDCCFFLNRQWQSLANFETAVVEVCFFGAGWCWSQLHDCKSLPIHDPHKCAGKDWSLFLNCCFYYSFGPVSEMSLVGQTWKLFKPEKAFQYLFSLCSTEKSILHHEYHFQEAEKIGWYYPVPALELNSNYFDRKHF